MDNQQQDWMYTHEQAMLREPSEKPDFYCLPCAEEGKKRNAASLDSKGEPVCDEHQLPDSWSF